MKVSIIILLSFILGVVLSYFEWLPAVMLSTDWSLYILPILMFGVGMCIGGDLRALYHPIKMYRWRVFLLPLATITGTLLFSALVSALLPLTVKECTAVGAGFGYYSLSAILLNQWSGYELGTIALISNISRELLTLLCAPILVRYFGKLAPIAAGGATTIDTTLPVIIRYSGQEYIAIAIFHGIILDASVPIIIGWLYS